MRTFVLFSLLPAACLYEPPPQPQLTHYPVAKEVVCASDVAADLDAAVMACMQATTSSPEEDAAIIRELKWQNRQAELEARRTWRAKYLWGRDDE
jgi:hypothetical protein